MRVPSYVVVVTWDTLRERTSEPVLGAQTPPPAQRFGWVVAVGDPCIRARRDSSPARISRARSVVATRTSSFLLSLFFIRNKNVISWETMPTFRKAGKKSTSYELLNNNVDYGTRKVDRMPAAYCDRASPYRDRVDFSDRTKRVCRSKNAGTVTPFYLCACKVIFVGDVATGKSSLVNRFCHEIFDAEYRGTIGVDFEVEKFQVLGHPYSLQM